MKYAKIELHLHLDGSLNIEWAYRKAIERNVINSNMNFEDFYHLLFAKNNEISSVSITKFDLTCALLQYYEDLYDATYDLCERLYKQGIVYAEIRFASQHHTNKGLTQLDAIKAVIEGANKAMEDFNIRIGIINCLMHKGNSALTNDLENRETIEASKLMFNKGLVGLDLAGYENNCDFNEYKYLFELINSYDMPYTIHAGEMGIGKHIIDAINMNPNRLGHGINCVQNENYINKLIETQMPMEVCLTSNVKRDMNYGGHPLRKLIERGCKVTLNSDNMMFARTNLTNEFEQASMLGIDDYTLEKLMFNALDSIFQKDSVKQEIKNKIII